jgi:hypothetical protein
LLAGFSAAIAVRFHEVATIWASPPVRRKVAFRLRGGAAKPWRDCGSADSFSARSRAQARSFDRVVISRDQRRQRRTGLVVSTFTAP